MSCAACRREEVMRNAQRSWTRLGDEMRKSPQFGRGRTRVRFAWLPLRDPLTRRWFWLRTVSVTERLGLKWTALAWGMGVVPSYCWRKESVR